MGMESSSRANDAVKPRNNIIHIYINPLKFTAKM
jgi:hypothetical protein